MNYFKKIISVLLLGFFAATLMAQQPLSLEDAIRKGLENNYGIRITRQNIAIAENNNTWGMAGRYPVLTLGVNQVNRFDNTPDYTGGGDRDKYYTNYVAPYVNMNWILFDGFSVNINKEKLELLQSLTLGNAEITIENTIQGIILAYYKILLEEEKLNVLESLMVLSRDRYNYMLAKQEIGSAVTYDVLQSKDAYLGDSSSYLFQKLNVMNAWLNLRLLLGETDNINYVLTGDFAYEPADYRLPDLIEKMKAGNRTIRNQYVSQEILKKEVGYQKTALYPTLGINAGADHFNKRVHYENTDPAYSFNLDYYANLSLGFNLFNGGRVKTAIQNARIEEQIGQLSIDQMEHSLTNLLINYYELYNIRKQIYQVSLVSVESAELNLQISGDKFKSGAINSFNYRDVQLVYLNAALGKLEAIYDLIDTNTELLRLTGGIIGE